MSKIDELIKELCPDGVKFYELGELGKFYGGLTGKSKEDFKDGNAKFITYMNVYKNPALDIDVQDKVKIGENENQRTLEYGDIIFTGSSETPDECGIASVVTKRTDEKLYLNSFCFFFRFNEPSIMCPDFAKHLFRSSNLRYQIGKTASGVTRFNVSKKLMEKVKIAVPPLEVQYEIVHILDDFMLLSAELSAELKARQKQYSYYEENLLNRDGRRVKLNEVCNICAGGTPSKTRTEYWDNGTIKWLGSTVCKNKKYVDEITNYITELGLEKSSAKLLKEKTTLIAMVGATIGKVAFLDFEATTNQNVACLFPKDENELNPDYLYYACKSLYPTFVEYANGKFAMASLTFIRNLEITIPDIEEQVRIVNILDRFDKICNNISNGLPAEIEARQKQYNYYRDKLLTFKEIGSE